MRGLHLHYNKVSSDQEIEKTNLPDRVIIPLHQHTGAPAQSLVKKGDHVKVGQKIGEATGYVSANIHASVSGSVVDIRDAYIPTGLKVKCITIESDGESEGEFMEPLDVGKVSRENILSRIREAGIVGMGGAQFPTHVKLDSKKPIDTFLVNGAECEPWIVSDHKLMVEQAEKIIKGIEIARDVLNVQKTIIAIEDNKKDAIEVMTKACKNKNMEVRSLKSIYPQGAEKTLIYNVLKRVVPMGGLPLDVGVVVQNVGTLKAIYDACYEGKPFIDRVVTITGSVKQPKNLLVRIGTPFKDLVEQCGGFSEDIVKVINGGPMMGIAQPSLDVPVIKGTNCILSFGKSMVKDYEEKDCIRCSRCVDACPQNLLPSTIALYAKKKRYEDCEALSVMNCTECGCCAYVCPAKIPIVQYAKLAKSEITERKRRRK